MKIGLVVPHIFMHRDILPKVIFSPGFLALELAEGLQMLGHEVTLFSPGPVNTSAYNKTADLSYFETELRARGDTYIDLLKKHPLTFITLARQVQAELLATAFAMANHGELDIVHVYTNEEDIALPFTQLCTKPVVFTHHDPFNFLVRYKNTFPKYTALPWISLSYAQRQGMPENTNWAGNIYHGLQENLFAPNYKPTGDYVAYLGRIIEPKGVHLAIAAIKAYNIRSGELLQLRIAGKHYSGHAKDSYWQEKVAPLIDGKEVVYEGFIGDIAGKQKFLGNAKALIVPSIFDEPFGMVMIEALACATPVIGLNSGAVAEVIENDKTGVLVDKYLLPAGVQTDKTTLDATTTIAALEKAIGSVGKIDRHTCRQAFTTRFTSERMCREHATIYKKLIETTHVPGATSQTAPA